MSSLIRVRQLSSVIIVVLHVRAGDDVSPVVKRGSQVGEGEGRRRGEGGPRATVRLAPLVAGLPRLRGFVQLSVFADGALPGVVASDDRRFFSSPMPSRSYRVAGAWERVDMGSSIARSCHRPRSSVLARQSTAIVPPHAPTNGTKCTPSSTSRSKCSPRRVKRFSCCAALRPNIMRRAMAGFDSCCPIGTMRRPPSAS